MIHQIFESPTAMVTTNTVAVGAVASPFWLDHVSAAAASLLPVFGCIWLIIQIAHFLLKKDKK